MSNLQDESHQKLRWGVYWLLIALAVGNMSGRILAVNSVNLEVIEQRRTRDALVRKQKQFEAKGIHGAELEAKLEEIRMQQRLQRPGLSGNDRSRWCTVRALVEEGTYAIDSFVTDPHQRALWNTIDMVKHRDADGEPHLYSSKPTLLPTLIAGEYWLIKNVTGLTLEEHPHAVVRMVLLTVNVIPMVLMFVLLARFVERFGTTDWGRIFVMASATFATFLSTFAVVLNNHLIAAVAAMIAIDAALRIWCDEDRRLRTFAVSGLFAAFAASCELPALSLFGLMGLGLFIKAPKPTLLGWAPASLVVIIAALGTNYVAHDTIMPAYNFRTHGKDWESGNWYNYSYTIHHPSGDPAKAREVDSYWKRDEDNMARRSQIDRGEASRANYAFHILLGHHGVFSLTPIWLMSLAGTVMILRGRSDPSLRAIGIATAIISMVLVLFYLSQGQENRNYGGMTSGLRWMFWIAPMWLMTLLPAADWSASSRPRRILAGVLLAFSVLSASYPIWNPWSHPWIARLLIYLEWIEL